MAAEREDEDTTELPRLTSPRRWWQEAAIFSAVATLLGSLAITGHNYLKSQFDRESSLHEIRVTYLDRALDPARSRAYRLSLLSFLVETFGTEDPMGRWADRELQQLSEAEPGGEFQALTEAELRQCVQIFTGREPPLSPGPGGGGHSSGELPALRAPADSTRSAGPPGTCCMSCEGMAICGAHVVTPCGECYGSW